MPTRDVVVVGASAGGVEALSQFVAVLPPTFGGSIFVVLHLPPQGTSVLPAILARQDHLPAVHPEDGEPIRARTIYVAPPDYHLLVDRGRVRLTRGPRENSHRPSIDVLFRSAARAYGPRVVGVVLSGMLDDGTAGLQAIKQQGGVAVVQSPDEALFSGMPRSALENVATDYCLSVHDMGGLLAKLSQKPVPERERSVSSEMNVEVGMAEMDEQAFQTEERPGTPSGFGCPECGGSLWELKEGELIRFRCRVGHAYSAEVLLAEQGEALEEALWMAVRALEEKAALAHRLTARSFERGHTLSAERFQEQAEEADRRAGLIRQVLLAPGETTPAQPLRESGSSNGHQPSPLGGLDN
jgi:two-component system chemotaxis response regulator CheB